MSRFKTAGSDSISACAYKLYKDITGPRGFVVLNDHIMPSVISCVCWVKKGISKEIPDQVCAIVIDCKLLNYFTFV